MSFTASGLAWGMSCCSGVGTNCGKRKFIAVASFIPSGHDLVLGDPSLQDVRRRGGDGMSAMTGVCEHHVGLLQRLFLRTAIVSRMSVIFACALISRDVCLASRWNRAVYDSTGSHTADLVYLVRLGGARKEGAEREELRHDAPRLEG